MMLPKQSLTLVAGLLVAGSLLPGCSPKEIPDVNLIPKPARMEVMGVYLNVDTTLNTLDGEDLSISYHVDPSLDPENPESYELIVTKEGIRIEAASEAGLFWPRIKVFLWLRLRMLRVLNIADCMWMFRATFSRKRR